MNGLFWRDIGTGRPLVLLHGGFTDHGMWDDQIPVLASRYRVIAPDARGHGRSANATEPYRLTDDLAALLRHLDTGPATLVGVSMGAGTAVDTALEHPELVGAVVVSGAGTSEPYFTDPWTVRSLAAWHAAMAAGDLDASIEGFMLFAAGPHRTLDDLGPEVVSRLRRMARDTMSKHTAGEPDRLVPVRGTWERIADIGVPVLAVNGTLDSPDHIGMAERLARTVADGRTASVDGTAHYPSMERPDVFNEILGGFLRTL
ncbi:alpha/beta fold hydrolase [Planomonospora venezuelensis]|uniref:Pimeloyl-ACP methyl ester carboxylesterase n=1 Tax=Planomonospora venezuelensis TaxID=1999 RepID=A0A841CYM0_PLAVE|nr:alpha/beta hydrolase [Planomonospora venezuelensis]MBB5961087.1 pimeloyl-ACP methyl ester carboxylesterase [Planomonospora venezuelensis]GIN04744.1 hydrolase [Planomonospora venezuelensis]